MKALLKFQPVAQCSFSSRSISLGTIYPWRWIVKIVDKRCTERDYEYEVCWKKTSLLERELENVQELPLQLEAKRQAQRGVKRGRLARADKDG